MGELFVERVWCNTSRIHLEIFPYPIVHGRAVRRALCGVSTRDGVMSMRGLSAVPLCKRCEAAVAAKARADLKRGR